MGATTCPRLSDMRVILFRPQEGTYTATSALKRSNGRPFSPFLSNKLKQPGDCLKVGRLLMCPGTLFLQISKINSLPGEDNNGIGNQGHKPDYENKTHGADAEVLRFH